ncbi:hypothetical protein VJ923_07330 [Adlercreutzia sp. R25]|uniref:hypothetical protein n=1 Tax=Adlercreutzia shanghongiae TaxID=3111773 RepID=UPI002DBEE477|nr:hypothetical protein [Adlercreutzia sp. R25]MEC4272966.1 hypothetical protein [Adlercreutzia sp. R25]
MLSTSQGFRRRVSDGARVLVRAQIAFASGERRDLDGSDFINNTLSFEQMTSRTGSFDIGAAIVGTFKCTLNNFDKRFEGCDFTGARIMPQLGVEVDGEVEWVRKGTYWIQQPSSYGPTISLSCDDAMSRLDVPYEDVGTSYPATASTVVRDICSHCDIVPQRLDFYGASAVFRERPEEATCRDVLSWAAQATGNWCRMTADDRLRIDWYDPAVFEDEDWLDGGEFDGGRPSYATGDAADGGNFLDYSSGDSFDGGDFLKGKVISIWATASEEVSTDDVEVTGVRVTASDETAADGSAGREGETHLCGSQGYVLDVSGNPLIAYGEARAAAERIAARAVGLRFRPFDVAALGDPRAEAGDPAVLTDRHKTAHRSFLTAVVYKVGHYTAFRCSARTPARNSASGSGAVTRALLKQDAAIRREKSAREAALERFQDDLENSSGMYATSKREGSGTTWYIHDKPELDESQFVWKLNAAGLGMSVDGGRTWQFGFDKWGDAILNEIYAIGIDADHIDAGALRVKSGGKTIFCADVRAGQFWWSTPNSSLQNNGTLTVTKGNIGGFEIGASYIRSNRQSLTSASAGVYIGANGVSTGNGYQWNAMGNGAFFGGSGGNVETGYISFNTRYEPTGVGGAAIGGKGCIGIYTPQLIVGGGWSQRNVSRYPAGYAGQSASKSYMTGSVAKQGSVSVTPYFGTLSNVAIADSAGKVTGRYTSVKYLTGVSISVNFPQYKAANMVFSQGLMVSV